MGAWGITVRQSDDGLDLLDTIVAEQLRKVNFIVFNVSEAITLLNQTIQEQIEHYKQKPPLKITDFYISGALMHDFTNAAILVAECLYDYYQTGELVVYDYIGENYDPVEYHIKNFIVTGKLSQEMICRPFWQSWKAFSLQSIGSIRDGSASKFFGSG